MYVDALFQSRIVVKPNFVKIKYIAHPLLTERIENACDIGTPATQLRAQWSTHPTVDFSLLGLILVSFILFLFNCLAFLSKIVFKIFR